MRTSLVHIPAQATCLIEGRLHLQERHVHYNTPGIADLIKAKGKTPAGKPRKGGVIATGWVDISRLAGSEVWVTRAAAAKMLDREVQWIDRLTEARLVRHTVDGNGELWVRLDPSWTPAHFAQVFNDTLGRPKTLADFHAYDIARGLFGYTSENPHPEMILDAAVDFLSDAGVFGLVELRGVLTMPVDPEALVKDLWTRYLGRSRSWPASRTSLDLETFRMIMPPAIANAAGTCWDAEEPEERPAPPPQMLARLARLQVVRDEASLCMLLTAGRGTTIPYLSGIEGSCRLLDDYLVATGADHRDPGTMTEFLEELAFGTERYADLAMSRRYEHARAILFLGEQLAAMARLSPRDPDRDLRPFRIALPTDVSGLRRRLNAVGEKLREEGRDRRKKRSDELSDGFDHILAAARRRCDQVADVTEDALVEAAALDDTDADYLDAEIVSWILNEDGTYGDGLQTIHIRVWKADRLWLRLLERGVLTHDKQPRNLVRDGLAAGEPYEHGKRYFEYRGVTPINGSTVTIPWFARLFACAGPLKPGLLPLELRERRMALIREWELPGFRPMKGGLLTFRNSSLAYRMAIRDGILLIPLEEFDHAMRAAHLAFRAGMIVGSRVNETVQMAHRSSEWPVLEIGPTARTGWLAVPKLSRDQGRFGEERKPRFYMTDDITFRYFTELAATVIRRSHPDGRIPDMPAAPTLVWKVGPKPYVFSLDGAALQTVYLNVCLRYLLAGVAVCTLHDARHAAANRGWVEGEDLGDTMLRLGHTTDRLSDYYRSATATQADVSAAKSLDRRRRGESLKYWESLFA